MSETNRLALSIPRHGGLECDADLALGLGGQLGGPGIRPQQSESCPRFATQERASKTVVNYFRLAQVDGRWLLH